ncbi:methyl coenzyme M reductase gamma subunit [Actinoplanes lutulentus]|uniref:Uncharacterized protein n=1 Tax=Actinoplanes lutulentus TaxID=1287878 RepID=A0A327ZCY8_9ACTN|nr:hypothetical protein [Actinoplanes lutulentus]MBB2948198.1 methyl coenzyme M reductase gamma subunit [Actinoplanes lutulentus]RAK31302.1 hypothetical protein B0I29_115108 [Actinoplanes lutulentus]
MSRRRSWPVEPRLACEVLRAVLPGWRVSHASGRYRATLVHGAGRSTVEAREASVVAVTIEALFDTETGDPASADARAGTGMAS